MIFKTIESSIDSSRKSIALFNKDWNTYVTNFKNASGLKGKAISIIYSNDVNCLRAYNQQITSGIKPSQAYKNTMTSCTKEAKQQAVAIAKGTSTIDKATESIKRSTLAATANKIAMSAMSIALNIGTFMLISAAVSKVVSTFNELRKSQENLRQSASELGSELSNNASDIESYKKKIDELKAVINDSSSSFDEVSQARIGLMAIQDELIEKFGTEKGVIESITSAINNQTDSLDELNKRSYFQAKNEFNEKTGGDKVADWFSFGDTSDDRIQSNMDKMVSSMRYSFYELESTGNEVLDELIAKSYGLNIVDDMYGNGKHFQIYGTLDEIQDKLYGIQELSQDFDLTTGFENSFTTISNDVDDALTKFKNLYDQYVLYEKILTDNPDNQYDEQFDLINKAKEAYNEAVKSGNEENLKTSADEYAKTLQSAIDLAMGNYDYDVAGYFKEMYPELQQMFGEWQFSLNFEPNTDGLKDKVSDALDSIDGISDGATSFSVEDIENFNPKIATQEQIDAYGDLTNAAETYGLTVKQLIALLQTMGLIQSEDYQQLIDTFGQDNVDKLSAEDLEIAYTIKNVGNMTFEQLQAEIQNIKNSANKDPVSLSPAQTITQLNTQLKPALDTLSTAWQNIFANDTFSLDSTDILSTCDAIRARLDEMSRAGLNVDYSSYDNFVRVLYDSESEVQDVENAFNSLSSSMTKAALTGAEDFDVMKAVLEDLGSTNSEMDAFTTLISNTEALKEAGLDLAAVSQMEESEADAAIRAFADEAVSAENLEQAISLLKIQKILCNDNWINSTKDINDLYVLALAAGIATDAIGRLSGLKAEYDTAVANNDTMVAKAIQSQMNSLKGEIESQFAGLSETSIDLSSLGGNAGTAAHAGRSAGASYVDAFEKELDNLKESRDQGKITEKEYLDYLRKLYQHFFRDKKKYAKEYDKYEQEYLQGMKSLYESALSGITSILDKQINAYEDSKSAAVDSLEAERDARIEVLEAQKDQYEEQIKLIEKQIEEKESMIDDINEEIDAIREANEERQRQLTLQEKQIALERMLNQRSILQYSADKGMHYVQDTDGIRGARQELDDAKTEMVIADKEKQISLIEKEIGLLEDRKDSINEQIELIDTQIDQINSQYDKMISNTEKYWDGLISGMESYKSRWQELAEIEEQAKLVSMLEQLGLNADEILNMSEASFVRFKDEYMGILADIYADNSSMLAGLSEASGRSVEELGSYLQATQGYIDGLSGIGESLNPAAEAINNVDSSMSTLAGSASSVNEQTSGIASGMSDLGGSTAAVSDNLNSIKTALMELPEADKFLAIAEAFRYLAGALQYVSSVLGAAGEEGQGGLAAQFGSLKSAIDQVTSAIGGGIGNNTDTEGLPSSEIGGSQTNGAQGGASLSKAFSDLQKTAAKAIGKEGNEGDGTVIGTFGSLKGTITDVANTIGFSESEEEDGEKTGGDEDSASLTTSITGLQSTTEETLGDPGGNGVIGRFEQFKNVLGEASEHVQSIPKGLEDIDGKKVECTIKVTIETNGSLPEGIDGNMNLTSAEYNAEVNGSANAAGTALVTGSWAVQSAQRHTLVGELGRELIVRDGRFFTVGNYGAEFVDIQKGDIVFNHKQTEHLLKNGYITGRGKAYADGTIGDPLACGKYSPIHPYGYTAQLQKAFDPLVRRLLAGEEKIMNNAFAGEPGQMEKTIREMNASNIFDKSTHPDVHVDGIHISCPGVTSTEVARQVGAELNHMFNGFHNYADQQSLIR